MRFLLRSLYYPVAGHREDLSILAPDGDVVFHLSLRPDEGQLVLNAERAGQWGEEQLRSVAWLARDMHVVELVCFPETIFVLSGGVLLASFALAVPLQPPPLVRGSLRWSISADDPPHGRRAGDLPAVIIEGIDAGAIRGRVNGHLPDEVEAELEVAGEKLRLPVAFPRRADLVARAAPGAPRHAFQVDPGPAQAALLADALAQGLPAPVRLRLLPHGEAAVLAPPPGAVETLDAFTLSGWVDGAEDGPALRLLANGQPVHAVIRLGGAPDAPAGSVIAARPRRGFELDLPPAIWAGVAPEASVVLTVQLGEAELAAGRIVLDRPLAALLAQQVAQQPALRHAAPLAAAQAEAAVFWPLLPEPVAAMLRTLAPSAAEPERAAPLGLGDRVEVLRLVIPAGSDVTRAINLDDAAGDAVFHLAVIPSRGLLLHNSRIGQHWGQETILAWLPESRPAMVVDAELGEQGVLVRLNHRPIALLPPLPVGLDGLDATGMSLRFARRAPAVPDLSGAPWVGMLALGPDGEATGQADPALRDASLLLELPDGLATLPVEWASRPARPGRLGFRARPDPAQRAALAVAAPLAARLGGAPLFLWPVLRPGATVALRHFVLHAELMLPPGASPVLALAVDGAVVDVAVPLWRDPAAPAGGTAPVRHLAEVDIPGFAWRGHAADAALRLDLLVDGRPVEPVPIELTREDARAMLEAAAAAGAADQRAALLAVEHLRFGGFLPELGATAAAWFADFARRMRLDGFLRAGVEAEEDVVAPPPATGSSVEKLSLWRALGAVNARITDPEAPLFPHVQAVAEEWGLTPERNIEFFASLLPPLCRHDELPRLKTLYGLQAFHHFADGTESWPLSLGLAVLACDRQVAQAAQALYRLAQVIAQGWPNTSCIAFAARHVGELAALGLVPQREVEEFRYALLGLFDGLSGDWFSRLHDRHMLEAMLALLRGRHAYPDFLVRDVVAAALKHYGLSPDFWAAWEAMRAEGSGAEPLLDLACRHFRALQSALADRSRLDAALPRVHAALRFFRQHANHEALAAMREMAAFVLRRGSTVDPDARAGLLAEIATAAPHDAVRFAASPGEPTEAELEALGAPAAVLWRCLRELHPVPQSQMHESQRRATVLIEAGSQGASAVHELAALAEALATPRGGHVGVDLFGLLAVRSRDLPVRRDGAVNRLGAALQAWLDDEERGPFLPAAMLSGLARLETLGRVSRDPFLQESLARLRTGIARRYGTLHDQALGFVPKPLVPLDPTRPAGDVIVAVYSCRAYLDSRVAAIRDTWMAGLRARGIACIVVVGEGDDTLDGDVLRLACSDRYEDLPEKTVRMVEWVLRHTDARYLIKADDDCYLHADNYFGSFEYRADHYHGRRLARQVGDMDRAWHQVKSQGSKALRLDRSPEPSTYCDGGGVYCLSRFAMSRLAERARSAEGQRLRALSFMEDKLVGDLLAMAGIEPSNTDYGSYQRRRTFGAAIPVGSWENTFFPSAAMPAKVAHLDQAQAQAVAHAIAPLPLLRPHRIWPAPAAVSLDRNASQLELVSDPTALPGLDSEKLGVVMAVRNEMLLLPHVIAHYRTLGVRAFYVVDNLSDDGSREWLAQQPDVALYSTACDYRASHYGVSWQAALLSQHFLGRWAVVADADEMLIYPHWRERPLLSLVAELEAEGAEAMPLVMVDMYPPGPLDAADFTVSPPFEAAPLHDREPVRPWHFNAGYFSNRSAVVSALRHRLLPDSPPDGFTSEKTALFRYAPWVRLSEGLHNAANLKLSRRSAAFAHFKYHRGFRAKVLEEVRRGQHFNGAAEYRRYAALLTESSGSFDADGMAVTLGEDGYMAGA